MNPIGAGGGLFSNVHFSMKKGFWKSQISWLFLIHYELSENQIFFLFFHSVFGWSRRCGLIQPPPRSQATSRSAALLGLRISTMHLRIPYKIWKYNNSFYPSDIRKRGKFIFWLISQMLSSHVWKKLPPLRFFLALRWFDDYKSFLKDILNIKHKTAVQGCYCWAQRQPKAQIWVFHVHWSLTKWSKCPNSGFWWKL